MAKKRTRISAKTAAASGSYSGRAMTSKKTSERVTRSDASCDRKTGIELSDLEQRVMSVFCRYLMTPGQMLCFKPQEQVTFKEGLKCLLERGYVVSEATTGAFSLTPEGYSAMKRMKST